MSKLTKRLCLLISICLSCCLFGGVALAEKTASVTVSSVVEEVKQTVVAKQDKLTPEQLDKELHAIIAVVFDFKTMARSSLAKHWSSATDPEKEEFVRLFSELLSNTYLKRIRDNVLTSKTKVVSEKKRGDTKAIVQTEVSYDKDQTVSIEYRMREKSNSWFVYDVVIENIGLVSNYRQEFDSIVKKKKISGLIQMLREKKESGQEAKS